MDVGSYAAIRAALTGLSNQLPRRAVLCGGPNPRLAEKAQHKDLPEVPVLSLACEHLRAACNEPVYSRRTAELARQCMVGNEPEAWRCLLDDAATDDLDKVALDRYMASDSRIPQRLVECIVGARTDVHLWLVVKAVGLMVPRMTPHMTQQLANAFVMMFGEVVATVSSTKPGNFDSDMRAATIAALGKLMVWSDISIDKLAAMLQGCIKFGRDDVLRLFILAPMSSMAAHSPHIVTMLLERAEETSQGNRYPSCALLAAMDPQLLKPHANRVAAVAHRSLDVAAAQGTLDSRLSLVCGTLFKAVSPPSSPMALLAHALCCTSLALLKS